MINPLIAPSALYEIIGGDNLLYQRDLRIEQFADMGIPFIMTGHSHVHNIASVVLPLFTMTVCRMRTLFYITKYKVRLKNENNSNRRRRSSLNVSCKKHSTESRKNAY